MVSLQKKHITVKKNISSKNSNWHHFIHPDAGLSY